MQWRIIVMFISMDISLFEIPACFHLLLTIVFPFFLICRSTLYILDMGPLSVICVLSIFFNTLFILSRIFW